MVQPGLHSHIDPLLKFLTSLVRAPGKNPGNHEGSQARGKLLEDFATRFKLRSPCESSRHRGPAQPGHPCATALSHEKPRKPISRSASISMAPAPPKSRPAS